MGKDIETQADFFAQVNSRLDRLEASMMEKFGNRRMTTRERIRQFNLAFGRPVNDSYTPVDIETRELLGNILLEEVIEYCVKGLGLQIRHKEVEGALVTKQFNMLRLVHAEGECLDPLEIVDGLADVNVVIHFNAHWHGINLDRATEIVDDSNMSKLGADGKPIINGVTPGYRASELPTGVAAEAGFEPSKPIGKILKGPDFYPPTAYLSELIATAGNNSEDS